MRVSDSQLTNILSLATMQNNAAINKVAEQIATGSMINNLSDDPAATVKLEGLNKTIALNQQYQNNIENVQSKYQAYETYMMSLNEISLEISDLLLQAKNGTMDPSLSEGIVTELESLKSQSLSTLNKQMDGTYLFSGTSVNSPAIDEEPPYEILGNDEHRETKVSESEMMQSNFTASEVLGSSSDYFNLLDAAIAEIQNPTDAFEDTLNAAIDGTEAYRNNIMASVSILGSNYSSMDRLMQNNIDVETFATTVQSDIDEVDYAEASVRLTQSMVTLQAIQTVFTNVTQKPSLFDMI